MSTWTHWHNRFAERARRPLPPLDDAAELPAAWRAPLARSLARFQIGEAGEGRIAHQVARVTLPAVDDEYRAALRLFVREEGRHARILGGMVRGLGGELLGTTWSERLFVRVRRLAGFRLKILVLLAAEVVGIGFYGSIAARLPAGKLRAALEEITGDEASHLDFHVDFLRRQIDGAGARWLARAAWLSIAGIACALVVVDHGGTYAQVGVGRRRALVDYARRILAVERALTGPAPARAAAEPVVAAPQAA